MYFQEKVMNAQSAQFGDMLYMWEKTSCPTVRISVFITNNFTQINREICTHCKFFELDQRNLKHTLHFTEFNLGDSLCRQLAVVKNVNRAQYHLLVPLTT